MEKPKKKVERKIGSTTYVISSHCTEFSSAAIKQKLIKLMKNEAAKKI